MGFPEFARLSTKNERGLKDTLTSVVGAVAITSALFIPPAIILKEAADTAANSIHINTEPTAAPSAEQTSSTQEPDQTPPPAPRGFLQTIIDNLGG
jgi:hypothetical protein